MNYPDEIFTIDEHSEFTIKEKDSTFTARVFHCESDEEANNFLTEIRKKYYDATHNCFAYKILGDTLKYSDDGEPNGTAGIRILNAIEHFNLLNIITIVTRYFGGTKLGVGPLGKAYYLATKGVLEKSKKKKKLLYQIVKIESDFDNINHVHRIISNHNATIAASEYGEQATFECLIKPEEILSVSNQLIDLSGGKISITPIEAKHYK